MLQFCRVKYPEERKQITEEENFLLNNSSPREIEIEGGGENEIIDHEMEAERSSIISELIEQFRLA